MEANSVHAYSAVVGDIVTSFAMAEFALDECLEILCGRTKVSVRQALNRKLEILRDSRPFLRTEGLSETLISDHILVMNQMKDLAEDRNWLVHGALLPSECSAHAWTVERIKFHGGSVARERRKYFYRDLYSICRQAAVIAANAMVLAHTLKKQM